MKMKVSDSVMPSLLTTVHSKSIVSYIRHSTDDFILLSVLSHQLISRRIYPIMKQLIQRMNDDGYCIHQNLQVDLTSKEEESRREGQREMRVCVMQIKFHRQKHFEVSFS